MRTLLLEPACQLTAPQPPLCRRPKESNKSFEAHLTTGGHRKHAFLKFAMWKLNGNFKDDEFIKETDENNIV